MATSFNYSFFLDRIKKDGTIPVKIRMIHNRTTKYLPTPIVITKDQLDKKGRIKDGRIICAVEDLLRKYRLAASEIPMSEHLSADDLVSSLKASFEKEKPFALDLFEYTVKKTATMERKTAEGYLSSIHSLQRYIGRETLDINEITYSFLVGYRDWLESEFGKGCRAASAYLSKLRHIHNLARDEFNDDDVGLIRIPRQPFKKGLIPPEPVTKHRVLTVEQMKALMAYEPVTERGRLAKDVFLLSFFLIGMNTVDIYNIGKNDIHDGVLTYNRAKTDSVRMDNALMMVRVEPEAEEIMERHKGEKRMLDLADRYSDHRAFNNNINIGLKEIGEAIGVPMLSTYYARHTWATIARNVCGVDFSTVHEALNHASRGADRVTDIYLARDFTRVWEANRKVINILI